jgi:hypothetical protein
MDASSQITPAQKRDGLAIASFVLGLTTLIFPTISVAFMIAVNGGPGYLQSLFCGAPVAVISIITGVVSLSQSSKNYPASSWPAKLGVGLGSLFFVTALILVLVLLFPFMSGTAH